MLSQLHLYNDAREREAIVLTYLALHQGKDGKSYVSDGDLSFVLAAIFRSATSGIVKEDTGPNTPLDQVATIVSRNK